MNERRKKHESVCPDKNIHRQFKTAGENALYIHCRRNSADSAVGYLYLSEYEIGVDPESEGKRDGWVNYDADSMSESMSVISDISKQMYFDEKIEHIAFHQYENYSEILADYRDYDTISDYLKYYYHEISSITLYLIMIQFPIMNILYM